MRWSDTTTFTFVEEYLKHECLFNFKCHNYRNKVARHAALVEICEVMNITDFGVKEAISKIKSIRSTYSQELKKRNESIKTGAGTDEVYVPTLKWFTLYHDVMKKDKNLIAKKNQSHLNSIEADRETMASAHKSSRQNVPDTASFRTESFQLPIGSRKRNIKSLDNLVNKIGDMVENRTSNNNEFDIFGKSVAAQLKAMPLLLALQAQSHIQNYLTSLRIHSIENPLNQSAHSFPPSLTTYTSTPSPEVIAEVSLDNIEKSVSTVTEEKSVILNTYVKISSENNDI